MAALFGLALVSASTFFTNSAWAATAATATAAAAAAAATSSSSAAPGSLQQVISVLSRVQASSEEASEREHSATSSASERCDVALRRVEQLSRLAHLLQRRLTADVEEQQASVKEARGTTRQLRASIALVSHTLAEANQTGHNTAMVENKQQSLASLNSELEVMLPTVAAAEGRSLEARRRLEEHGESTSALQELAKAAAAACSSVGLSGKGVADRSDRQRASMDEALKSLRALQEPTDQPSSEEGGDEELPLEVPTDSADEQQQQDEYNEDSDVSFVQLKQVQSHQDPGESGASDLDLMSIFGSGEADAAPQSPADEASDNPTAASLLPTVDALLKEARNRQEGGSHPAWCKKEHLQGRASLRLASASARELSAEAEEHGEVSEQFAEELTRINSTASLVTEVGQNLTSVVAAQRLELEAADKDEKLASQILAQATKIVNSMSDQAGRESALAAMQAASESFIGERPSSTASLRALETSVAKASEGAAAALERERKSLGFAHESHLAARDRAVGGKTLYDAQLKSTMEFLKQLEKECKAEGQADPEQAVEIHALQDAKEVLEGQALTMPAKLASPRGGLRGSSSSSSEEAEADKPRTLSPLEQAAEELGVAV